MIDPTSLEHMKYLLFSVFCGWGGGDRALHEAQFFSPWAIDWDFHSRTCFKLNSPMTRVARFNLFKDRYEYMMKELNISHAEPTATLIASPCQGASSAGLCNPYDERNMLTVRALRHGVRTIGSPIILLENVSGIVEKPMAPLYNLIQDELKALSDEYTIAQELLNTKGFGTPQNRERYILCLAHKSLGVEASLPEPSTFSDKGHRIEDVLPHLDGIHYGYGGKKFKHKSEVCNTITKTPNIWASENGAMRDFRIDELLKLCGYPADWKYTGSYNQVWNRIGNSIMPPFMQAIGEHVRINILEKAGVPKTDIRPYIEANRAYDAEQVQQKQQKKKTKKVTTKT